MGDFLRNQLDYIFFLYGLAFFVLAAVCFFLWKSKRTNLPWLWFGLFAFTHGINEWFDLVSISIYDNVFFSFFRLCILLLSYLFLVEFSRQSILSSGRKSPSRAILYTLFLLPVCLGFTYGLTGLNVSIRYSLGFLSSLFAAWTIFRFVSAEPSGKPYLRSLSTVMFFYAFATGIVVPKAALFPANVLNYELFLHSFGFPIQLLRSILALLAAFISWLYLESLRPKETKVGEGIVLHSKFTFYSALVLSAFIAAGWFFTDFLGAYARKRVTRESESAVNILSNRIYEDLKKMDEVAMTISGSPWIAPLLVSAKAENLEKANSVLDRYNRSMGASVSYLLDKNGTCLASSNRNMPDTFVGKSYAFRPYFKEAISGKASSYFAVGATSGEKGYYSGYPVKDAQGATIGVVVIKKNMTKLENYFKDYSFSFLVDDNGIVFLSSYKDHFTALWPVSEGVQKKIIDSKQFEARPFKALFPKEILNAQEVLFQGQRFYVSRFPIQQKGWFLVILNSARIIYEYRFFAVLITLILSILIIVFSMVILQRDYFLELVSSAKTKLEKEIEERKAIDSVLKESEAKYRSLVENIGIGVALINPQMEVLMLNSQMKKWFPGANVHSICYRVFNNPSSDDLCLYCPTSLTLKDGQIHEALADTLIGNEILSFRIVSSPVKDSEGRVFAAIEMVEDITQRKRAEEFHSRLAAIVDSSDDAIISKTLEGSIVSWNKGAEKMYGYLAEEVIGKPVSILMPPEINEGMPQILEKIKKDGKVSRYETIRLKKDGTRIDVSLTISPIKDGSGRIVGASTIARDITERKKLDKLKDEFVSTVSHELRTPLSITKEGISLILEGVPGAINEKQQKILKTSKDNIDRLARIINELLDISRIEAGKVDIMRESVSISELIAHVASLFDAKIIESGLELVFNLPDKVTSIYVDPDKIIQVFTNLIDNALKFTRRGTIEISVIEKKNEIECSVTDTGIGIAGEDLPKVFNKFEQFVRFSGAGQKGTGLGLAIAKGIILMHRGNIWVESVLGKGTKFTFTLPIYSYNTLMKETIATGIKDAVDNSTNFSLIVISVLGVDKLKDILTAERMRLVLKNIETVIKNSLRRPGDAVLKDSGEFTVFLRDCEKETALRTEGRLERTIKDYLAAHDLDNQVHLKFGCSTFPEDASDADGLISIAKKA